MIQAGAWQSLDEELAHWQRAGRKATLWWRDDDAGPASPALAQLLALARRHGVPLALAVVPAWATPELAAALGGDGLVAVLQHGYAHANHAPEGEKKCELGPERPAPVVVGEIAAGWQQLEILFGGALEPVMVPPWNRMAPYLPPYLAELRFRGLSQFGPRARATAAPGLAQVNTHVDIVHWKSQPPRFAGATKLADEFAGHLAARRTGAADADEPTGLLTHHAAHDAECWAFLEELLARFARHAAVEWLPPSRVFA